MVCHSACDIGDAIRHGTSREPPISPPVTAEEAAHEFIDGVRLKCEKDVLDAAVVLLSTEMAAEPSIRETSKTYYVEVTACAPDG